MTNPPFNDYLGIEIVRKDAGSAEAALDLLPHHLNRRGVAHGGVVASLLDSALGAAVISSIPAEWWCATTSLATQFHDGAGSGRLIATGRVLRRGARIAFAEGEVRDQSHRRIATAHGTWHLWRRKPGGILAATRGRVLVRTTGESIPVGKVVAVGRNYPAHVAEMGAPAERPPVFFLKPATAVVGGAVVRIPAGAGAVHHEVELVVVIGRSGRSIPAELALDHVLGFAVGLDLTLREVQAEAKRRGEPWSLSKGFDDAAPLSAVAARDEVGDGSGLGIRLAINGHERQSGNTSEMIRSVPELIAEASRFMTLERGDLLMTGTPAGVGPIVPGDRIEAAIERVGTLSLVVEEAG
jgi:uncharacterized protein (TIGR00369 family)